ncbi:hypothetical protein COB57_04605 [Candidatus Peregrinibacteria bacterium]|nr:MAG: hypothetical protein COB57_04605 [Candidatus Peregrinibacteria bacterium]
MGILQTYVKYQSAISDVKIGKPVEGSVLLEMKKSLSQGVLELKDGETKDEVLELLGNIGEVIGGARGEIGQVLKGESENERMNIESLSHEDKENYYLIAEAFKNDTRKAIIERIINRSIKNTDSVRDIAKLIDSTRGKVLTAIQELRKLNILEKDEVSLTRKACRLFKLDKEIKSKEQHLIDKLNSPEIQFISQINKNLLRRKLFIFMIENSDSEGNIDFSTKKFAKVINKNYGSVQLQLEALLQLKAVKILNKGSGRRPTKYHITKYYK